MIETFRNGLVVAAAALLCAACAQPGPRTSAGHGLTSGGMPATAAMGAGRIAVESGSRQLQQHMEAGALQLRNVPPSGDIDRDFVRLMRLHRQQGVDMARIQLEKGNSPEARRLAKEMLDEQLQDIALLDDWLRRHP